MTDAVAADADAADVTADASADDDADDVAALARTHLWFEVNSGWAPPDEETMIDWSLEGICRAPDECLVAEYGTCAHGLVSWRIVLDDLADHDAANHGAADHGAGNHDVTDHAADRVARPD